MKKKIVCFLLILVPIIIFGAYAIRYSYNSVIYSQAIKELSPHYDGYNLILKDYYESLTINIVWAITSTIGFVCCIAALVVIFRKDFLSTKSSIVEQWHTYKQTKAEQKAANNAEQIKSQIEELERKLNELKKDE